MCAMRVRKSIAVHDWSQLVDTEALQAAAAAADDEHLRAAEYEKVIDEARKCVGHGSMEGAFPEEWDAQLLIDCGRAVSGNRLVIFCPTFLQPLLDSPEELDRAFRFILLSMHDIAMSEKFDFVYCYLGMDWSDPRLATRLRIAYDILPRQYAKHLRRLYILHPTSGFRVTMWTFWAWLSKRLWDKVEYVESLDELCQALQPKDSGARAELRRRFPQMVQRNDAERLGVSPAVTFGVPLRQICNGFGVDYVDKTTGRYYPKLPPALIFLCEAMEREAADEDFYHLFDADASAVYKLVETIDHGKPLDQDLPMGALWCVLKLFLDCLPTPLLSFQGLDELEKRGVKPGDIDGHRRFLCDIFHRSLPADSAYAALYIASFLHTMCQVSQDRRAGGADDVLVRPLLTPAAVAKVFAPGFLRPKVMAGASPELLRAATAVTETLVACAEEPEIWIGSSKPRYSMKPRGSLDSSSDSDEDG